MDYEIVVLSEDAVFARMLELEFSHLRFRVLATDRLMAEDRADVLLLDLDSASAPPSEQYRRMIGFSRHSATGAPDARSCSMILRRPFRMSLFRQEVLAQLEQEASSEQNAYRVCSPEKRQISLDCKKQRLLCDGQEIALTPKEAAVLERLLQHRGRAVSRAQLLEIVGSSEKGNEAEVYVCYLRRKTDGLPNGRLIQTVRGKGYQIP